MSKTSSKKKFIGYIDVTPTWASMVPAIIALIENGNAQGRATAIGELNRMADLADKYVAQSKSDTA